MNKKSFLKHSGLAFVTRSIGGLAGFLMSIVITRTLSVEDSGLFFLAHALCSAVGMLCTLGLTNAFVRFLGGFHAEANWGVIKGVFNRGLITVLLMSIIVSILFFFCSDFISNNLFNSLFAISRSYK